MADIANLQIRIQSLEAEVADRRLGRLANSGQRAERATDGLTASFVRFAGPIAAAAGAAASLHKLIDVTREFEVLNAQLITATGSAENAEQAFLAIQDFASATPYDLQQVTEAFTKLVNLGLTPSEAALTSYGNTASAMGKDLSQLIEAVADAATGEFERLKEFGIKSKSEGDQVSFTFRGITTTVGKNAAEIEAYLQALGENEFAGAMAQRMATLDGALSNLGDEWDKFYLNVSNLGIGDAITDGVRSAIDILTELNAMLASGEMQAYLEAIIGKFEGFGRDVATTLDIISGLWDDFLGTETGGGIVAATVETIKFIVEAFKNLPENIRTVIQLMAVEIAALVDYAKAYGSAFGEVLGSEFAKLVEKSKAYGKAMGIALNPFSDEEFDLEGQLKKLDDLAAEMSDGIFQRAEQQANATRQARRESILGIMEERDAALASFDAQIRGAEDLRKKYDEEIAARQANTEDRLAGFGIGPATPQAKPESKDEASARKKREQDFENLRKSLLTEEEAIQESYDERLAILLANTERGSALQLDLKRRLDEQLKSEQGKELENLALSLRTEEEVIQESYKRRLAIILDNTEEGSTKQAELKQRLDAEFATQAVGDLAATDTYEEQLSQIDDFYKRRLDLILNNVALTEQQRTDLETELTKQRDDQLAQLESARMSSIFQNSSQLFDGLAGLAKTFGGEQSKLYKVMFAASKAFAIADSIVKIQEGIANASILPWPANLGAIASTVAATAGIVSTIQSTTYQFAGAYDKGGNIPAGQIGLVGEYGPELIQGPINVTSRKETADMLKRGSNVVINVINNAQGVTVETRETDTGEGRVIEMLINRTKNEIGRDIREGGGIISRELERTYNVRRGAR